MEFIPPPPPSRWLTPSEAAAHTRYWSGRHGQAGLRHLRNSRMVRGTKRSYSSHWGPAAAYGAGRLAAAAVEGVAKRIRRFASGESGNTGGSVVTNQFDARTVYRRKRLNRRGRRRLRRKLRFVSRVRKGIQEDKEPQQVVFRENFRITSEPNAQAMFGGKCFLYSLEGIGAGNRDISRIVGTGAGDSATSVTKYYFTHAGMELSIKNVSATNDCYLELYYWVGRKRLNGSNSIGGLGAVSNLDGLINSGFAAAPANLSTAGSLDDTTFGATPFQNIALLQFVKIYKKVVIHLSPGQITDINLSQNRNTMFDGFMQISQICWDKRAKGVMIVQYGGPNTEIDTTAGQPLASDCNYQVVRSYNFTNDRAGLVDASAQILTA